VELTDRIIPSLGLGRSGPAKPPEVTDAELACLAVAQVLLRYDDERHWLRAAPARLGHLFPRLLGQSEYNQPLKERSTTDGSRPSVAGRPHASHHGDAAADGRYPSPVRAVGHHRPPL
jgi:hypothetical protein